MSLYSDIPDHVIMRYMESHRHYHTLEHIYSGLAVLEQIMDYEEPITDVQVNVHIAWWYHDSIYVPGSPRNEQDSAQLACQDGWGNDIERLIMATRYPHYGSARLDEAIIMDADLYGLCTPRVVFERHTEQVRQEFDRYTNDQWNAGRLKFWKGLVAAGPIYHTDWGRRYESAAQANIAREIEILETQIG